MRAANMQALTNDMKNRFPGMTIYGIGDAAHKLEPSDHNEDDTPGSLPEQTDSDNVPEHRAIDLMLGSVFTFNEADALVAKMVNDVPTRKRLHYIIWNGYIWESDNGWARQKYYGSDPHTGHVHVSGLASNDEDASPWPIVYAAAGSGPNPQPPAAVLRRQWPSYMPTNQYFGDINGPNESHGGYYVNEQPDVRAIQKRMQELGFAPTDPNWADGIWEQPTTDAVAAWQRRDWAHTTSRYGEVWYDDWYHLFTY